MDNKEKVRLIATATAAFIAGHDLAVTRMRRKLKVANRQKKTTDKDVAVVLQKWYNDVSDTRTFNDVMEEWFYHNRFQKIIQEQK